MTDKKDNTSDIPIEKGEKRPRYEVRIGEGLENIAGRFDTLEEAKACLARKRRLDRVCYVWDRSKRQKV